MLSLRQAMGRLVSRGVKNSGAVANVDKPRIPITPPEQNGKAN
jgi:hypothetical protein